MGISQKLAIVLPTYNRAETIDFFLKVHVPILKKFNIGLYISDNASPDHTLEVIEKWQSEYEGIFVTSQEKTVAPDVNVEAALHMSSTDYTWLIGDTYEIPEKTLAYILTILTDAVAEYDVVIPNLSGMLRDIEEQHYTDQNKFLEEVAWMATCIACKVCHRSIIENMKYQKYHSTDFAHLGFILDHVGTQGCNVYWAQTASVVALKTPVRKSGWGSEFFKNTFERWPHLIELLPDSYSEKSKQILLAEFPSRSRILAWRNTILLRSQGVLNRTVYSQYQDRFAGIAPHSFVRLAGVLIYTPKSLCHVTIKGIEWVRRKNYQIRKRLNPGLIR